MIKLDLQSRVPLYEQLQEQIIHLSLMGVLEANEQLPSVRSLAREVGVNPNTVAKAYQELERRGAAVLSAPMSSRCNRPVRRRSTRYSKLWTRLCPAVLRPKNCWNKSSSI